MAVGILTVRTGAGDALASETTLFVDEVEAAPVSVASQKTGYLIQQILTAAGWTLPALTDVDVTKGDLVPNFTMAGTVDSRSALQSIADLLEAERGIFFIKADGTAHYEDRYTVATKAATESLTDVFDSVAPGVSLDGLLNRVRVIKTGNDYQEARDEASIDLYGPSDGGLESAYLPDVASALALAKMIVAQRSSPTAPVWGISTVGNYDLAHLKAMLGIEVGDRITVVSTTGGLSGDWMVESIKHHFRSVAKHEIQLALSRRMYGTAGQAELFTIGTSTLSGTHIFAYY